MSGCERGYRVYHGFGQLGYVGLVLWLEPMSGNDLAAPKSVALIESGQK